MGRPKGSKNKPKTAKGNQGKTSTKARPASNYELRLRKPVEANGELNQNEKEIAQETETVLNTTTNQINENLVQDKNIQVNDKTENNDFNVVSLLDNPTYYDQQNLIYYVITRLVSYRIHFCNLH